MGNFSHLRSLGRKQRHLPLSQITPVLAVRVRTSGLGITHQTLLSHSDGVERHTVPGSGDSYRKLKFHGASVCLVVIAKIVFSLDHFCSEISALVPGYVNPKPSSLALSVILGITQ